MIVVWMNWQNNSTQKIFFFKGRVDDFGKANNSKLAFESKIPSLPE